MHHQTSQIDYHQSFLNALNKPLQKFKERVIDQCFNHQKVSYNQSELFH